jgi:hypothetical protein
MMYNVKVKILFCMMLLKLFGIKAQSGNVSLTGTWNTRRKHVLYIIIALCAVSHGAFAQVSTMGTDFYVAFGRNLTSFSSNPTGCVYQIRIVATQAADITLTFKESGAVVSNIHVNAGDVYTYNLDNTQKTNLYSAGTATSNKSLRIQSTTPVSVYALNQTRGSADATNIFPVSTLGTDYYHISYITGSSATGYLVIATEDNTTVYDGATLVATLNTGQVYSYYTPGDITGRHITSNNPVAYFVVDDALTIPYGVSYLECLFQQMVSVNAWGTTFLVPVTHRGLERVRIVASQDDTQVTQTGGVKKTDGGGYAQNPPDQNSFTLNAGQFVELEISLASGGCYINASKPVGVGSFLVGSAYPGLSAIKGDPGLAWIPPIEQTINSAAIAPFVSTSTTVMDEHHALVITPTATRSQTTLAIGANPPGPLSGGTWTTGNGTAGSAYSFYSLQLTNATSSYFFANPNGLFVLGYGIGYEPGWGESYYYLAGASVRNLVASFYINDVHYQDIDGTSICGQSSFAFRAVTQYALSSTSGYLKWYIDGVEEIVARDLLEWDTTLAPGNHTISMVVIDMSEEAHTLSSTITIAATPAAPTLNTPPALVCSGNTGTATVTPPTGCTTDWYDTATGGTAIVTGNNTLTTGVLTAITTIEVTYYAESRNTSGGCTSITRTPVDIPVSPCAVPVNPHLRSGVVY